MNVYEEHKSDGKEIFFTGEDFGSGLGFFRWDSVLDAETLSKKDGEERLKVALHVSALN